MTPDGITLVIGGSRGIGAATATLLAEQGRKVIVVDILPEPALETGIAWGALSKERLIRNAAMNRLVEPIEVAQAIGWLLSPASSGVTGINLPVNAGFLAGSTWDAYGGLRESPSC
jgi:NAD(P)-dependent dehydrogenase (short-subunit alcohol dehydrogenase family)